MALLAAIRFLTAIPLPWGRDATQEEFVRSVGYYPVVGLIIGLILAGLSWLLRLILPSAVVNIVLIIYLVMISGAIHLDGFVDTCDGIGGHKTAEERRQVMRDSRVGGFGVIGACCLLLAKYISLNSVPQPLLMSTLVLMPVISRWAMVYAICAYPSASPSGLGKERKQASDWTRFILATFITLVIAIGLAWWANITYYYLAGPAIIVGIWVIVIIMGAYFKHKFNGLTGDTYGAINEVTEVGVLIMVVLLAHNQWLGLT